MDTKMSTTELNLYRSYYMALERVEHDCLKLADDLTMLMAISLAVNNMAPVDDEEVRRRIHSAATALGPLFQRHPELRRFIGTELEKAQ
jgi:hypothetical protein